MKSLYEVIPCSRQARELLERPALAQVGDRDVEAHVDDLLPLALAVPGVERLARTTARRLDAEVDVRRRPAERGRGLAGRDVVDRGRAAERHVEVRVRVDAAREHVAPVASITRSASTSSDSPTVVMRSPST